MASSLPQEIISEILSRLPVKSLLRFTIVCKSWKSLIKNPNFIKLHLNQTLASNSDRHLIISQGSLYISDINLDNTTYNLNSLSFSELHNPLKANVVFILGSCNGILCVSYNNLDNVFLYNPLTNWHLKIPVNYLTGFEPSIEEVIYGFGYDSLTDDYKVFSFFLRFHDQTSEVVQREAQVMSFKSNSWKNVECIYQIHGFHDDKGVYLNDAIFYVVSGMKSSKLPKFILKFDCRTDNLLRMECPNCDDGFKTMELSALRGCLCILVKYFLDKDDDYDDDDDVWTLVRVDLWMMNESWVRLFSICDPRSIGSEYMISTVVFSRDERKILLKVDQSKYGWYDMEDGSFERITTTLGDPHDFIYSTFCILGSLVSLVDNLEGASSETMPKKLKRVA